MLDGVTVRRIIGELAETELRDRRIGLGILSTVMLSSVYLLAAGGRLSAAQPAAVVTLAHSTWR